MWRDIFRIAVFLTFYVDFIYFILFLYFFMHECALYMKGGGLNEQKSRPICFPVGNKVLLLLLLSILLSINNWPQINAYTITIKQTPHYHYYCQCSYSSYMSQAINVYTSPTLHHYSSLLSQKSQSHRQHWSAAGQWRDAETDELFPSRQMWQRWDDDRDQPEEQLQSRCTFREIPQQSAQIHSAVLVRRTWPVYVRQLIRQHCPLKKRLIAGRRLQWCQLQSHPRPSSGLRAMEWGSDRQVVCRQTWEGQQVLLLLECIIIIIIIIKIFSQVKCVVLFNWSNSLVWRIWTKVFCEIDCNSFNI